MKGLIIVVLSFVILSIIFIVPVFTSEEITIRGSVTNVELYNTYYELTMDDNITYKISYAGDYNKFLDFTDNSIFIIKMSDMNIFYPDGIWDIIRIVKLDKPME